MKIETGTRIRHTKGENKGMTGTVVKRLDLGSPLLNLLLTGAKNPVLWRSDEPLMVYSIETPDGEKKEAGFECMDRLEHFEVQQEDGSWALFAPDDNEAEAMEAMAERQVTGATLQ